jgi:hypothetical protein
MYFSVSELTKNSLSYEEINDFFINIQFVNDILPGSERHFASIF